jgi:serpin B
MMWQTGHYRYVHENGLAAIELPYADDDLSMIVIMPDGDIDKMGESLTLDQIKQLAVDMHSEKVDLFLPRFKLEASYGLGGMLSDMGMPDAFIDQIANFSGMTGQPGLYIGSVIHKARVEVNEEGSEAAAATAVIMDTKSFELEMKQTFRADHPFLFIIVHNPTGAILFMGRMSKPTI